MKSLIALILCLSVVSCGGSNFASGTSKKAGIGPNNQTSVDQTKENINPIVPNNTITPGDKDPNNPFGVPPGSAVIPIAIGGASLLCIPDASAGMLCAGDGSDAANNFAPVKAYYATELDRNWVTTIFQKRSAGIFVVQLPEDLRKAKTVAAVMLVDSNDKYMADMDFESSLNLGNLVANGSFEDTVVDPDKLESRIFEAHEQKTWKSYRVNYIPPVVGTDCKPILEISSSLLTKDFKGSDGSQWLELQSPCEASAVGAVSSIGVTQELKTIKGHKYRFSFAYRNSGKAIHQLNVKWDGVIISAIEVSNLDWSNWGFDLEASSDKTAIAFEEVNAVDDRATNIDSVMVIDLTATANTGK